MVGSLPRPAAGANVSWVASAASDAGSGVVICVLTTAPRVGAIAGVAVELGVSEVNVCAVLMTVEVIAKPASAMDVAVADDVMSAMAVGIASAVGAVYGAAGVAVALGNPRGGAAVGVAAN